MQPKIFRINPSMLPPFSSWIQDNSQYAPASTRWPHWKWKELLCRHSQKLFYHPGHIWDAISEKFSHWWEANKVHLGTTHGAEFVGLFEKTSSPLGVHHVIHAIAATGELHKFMWLFAEEWRKLVYACNENSPISLVYICMRLHVGKERYLLMYIFFKNKMKTKDSKNQ